MALNPFMNLFPNLFAKPQTPVASDGSNPMLGVLAQMLQQPAPTPATPGLDPALIQSLLGGGTDEVGAHNRRSNLPSSNPDSTGPWSGPTPFFKPMDEAFKDTGQRENPILGFANPSSPQNRGVTTGVPEPWGSSFISNSGDDGPMGRSAANRYGSGSSTFGSPQVPAGPRLAANDPWLMIQSLLAPQAQPKPFAFGFPSLPRF